MLGALDTAREVVSPAEEEASLPSRPSTSPAALGGGAQLADAGTDHVSA